MPILKSKERPEKILLAMYELASGTTKGLKYEDIVVKAFTMFPEEFSLRGYPQFPDSSDIHKPLYGPLTRRGLVRSANKSFALTPSGVEVASRLLPNAERARKKGAESERLGRDAEVEVERMLQSAALQFFVQGQKEKTLDTDFYAFLGCTVRTPRNEFLGRLERTEEAIADAVRLKHPAGTHLKGVLAFLKQQFNDIIQRRRQGK